MHQTVAGRGAWVVVGVGRLGDAPHLGSPGALGYEHDGAGLGGVVAMGVDAANDEEDEVDDGLEPGEDGAGDEDGIPARGLVAVLVAGVAVAIVARVAVVTAPVAIVVQGRDGEGGREATHDGGGEPDDKTDTDMGAGVDTTLEFPDSAGNELGAAPEDGNAGLQWD